MRKDIFQNLEKEIGLKATWEDVRKEKNELGTVIEMQLKVFDLDKESYKRFNSIVPRLPFEIICDHITRNLRPGEKPSAEGIFENRKTIKILFGFIDKGWSTLAFSEWDAESPLSKLYSIKSVHRDNDLCFLITPWENEQGGTLSGFMGFDNKIKQVEDEMEVRIIHNFGLCRHPN